MTFIELKEFYDNIDKVSPFYRIRMVYNLTNDLDYNLLRYLRRDFFKHHLLEARKNIDNLSDTTQEQINEAYEIAFSDDVYMYYIEDLIEEFCRHIPIDFLTDFIEKTNIFFPELDELESISYSRLKNNLKTHQSDTQQTEITHELEEVTYAPLVKKVIYLEKLGIIDFIKNQKPFNTSINSMANVLANVIGANPASLQPLLNGLINDVDSSKNPLHSKKNVNAVETYLIKIGFNLKNN